MHVIVHIQNHSLQLNVLDIYQINTFYTANFMFLYHNHYLPSSLNTLFTTGSQIHTYDTRQIGLPPENSSWMKQAVVVSF